MVREACAGYRNDQFAVQRAAWFTLEPRWRFGSGAGFVFYDGAYLNRRVAEADNGIATEELYRDAFGVGLIVLDARRSVELSLGWNRDAAFDQPRLSVRLSSDL